MLLKSIVCQILKKFILKCVMENIYCYFFLCFFLFFIVVVNVQIENLVVGYVVILQGDILCGVLNFDNEVLFFKGVYWQVEVQIGQVIYYMVIDLQEFGFDVFVRMYCFVVYIYMCNDDILQ